jgi:hypothetical protein
MSVAYGILLLVSNDYHLGPGLPLAPGKEIEMKCHFCEKQAEGIVVMTYHDGSTLWEAHTCYECGMMYDNPSTTTVELDDGDEWWGTRESWYTPYSYE